MKKVFAAAIAALALSGCSGMIGPGPAPQRYTLNPHFSAVSAPPGNWALWVGTPATVDSLDTQRIALTRPPTQMDYFANAAWTDRAPVLLQGLMIEAFETSGRTGSVAREAEGLNADYVLQTDLRDFDAQYDQAGAPPNVTVRISAKLIRYPERTVAASTEILQQARAQANDMNAIVMAFDQATGAALTQLVQWALAGPSASAEASMPAPLRHRRHHRR